MGKKNAIYLGIWDIDREVKVVEQIIEDAHDLGIKIFNSLCFFNRELEASQGGGFRNNESLPRVPQGGTRQSGRGQKKTVSA